MAERLLRWSAAGTRPWAVVDPAAAPFHNYTAEDESIGFLCPEVDLCPCTEEGTVLKVSALINSSHGSPSNNLKSDIHFIS